MLNNELVQVLTELGNKVVHNTRGTINRGGCCYFAARIAQVLNNYNIDARVLAEGYEGRSCYHAWVEFEYKGVRYHYDAEMLDIVDEDEYFFIDRLTAREAAICYARGYRHGRSWNKTFNTSNIPIVSDIIREYQDKIIKGVQHDN